MNISQHYCELVWVALQPAADGGASAGAAGAGVVVLAAAFCGQ